MQPKMESRPGATTLLCSTSKKDYKKKKTNKHCVTLRAVHAVTARHDHQWTHQSPVGYSRVSGVGFRVQGFGQGFGFRVQGYGFGFRVQGYGFWLWFRVQGFTDLLLGLVGLDDVPALARDLGVAVLERDEGARHQVRHLRESHAITSAPPWKSSLCDIRRASATSW